MIFYNDLLLFVTHFKGVMSSTDDLLNHFQLFYESLYNNLKKTLNEANLANTEMAHAWRCLLYDATTRNPLGLPYGSSSRPGS